MSEAKYLVVENYQRYRSIMRYCYRRYESFACWIYKEEIYAELKKDEYFNDYTLDELEQDLTALVNWKNLISENDNSKVYSVEDFKNRRAKYQLSEYSVRLERMTIELEKMDIEGASLEVGLMERLYNSLKLFIEDNTDSFEESYNQWFNLNNDFKELNKNYQDYYSQLSNIDSSELIKSVAFINFKTRIVEYLKNFIEKIYFYLYKIEPLIEKLDNDKINKKLQAVAEYEAKRPNIKISPKKEELLEGYLEKWHNIKHWFVSDDLRQSEVKILLSLTNDIISKITRYAYQIMDMISSGANRKEEYKKICQCFLNCQDLNEAHKLSSVVFGVTSPLHIKGDFERKTDSINSGVYDEEPFVTVVKPNVRTYRQRSERKPVKSYEEEKELDRLRELKRIEREKALAQKYINDGKICFSKLPILEPEARNLFLKWISKGFESEDLSSKTEYGWKYHLQLSADGRDITIKCTDGELIMSDMDIVFEEV